MSKDTLLLRSGMLVKRVNIWQNEHKFTALPSCCISEFMEVPGTPGMYECACTVSCVVAGSYTPVIHIYKDDNDRLEDFTSWLRIWTGMIGPWEVSVKWER